MTAQRQFISAVSGWAASQSELLGVVLVGSYARGSERQDSDIDLVFVTRNPRSWLETDQWLEQFGNVRAVEVEDYGPVQSRRVHYENDIEVEFGITTDEWLNTAVIDEGSRKVMLDGHRILDDKAGLFSSFLSELHWDQTNEKAGF